MRSLTVAALAGVAMLLIAPALADPISVTFKYDEMSLSFKPATNKLKIDRTSLSDSKLATVRGGNTLDRAWIQHNSPTAFNALLDLTVTKISANNYSIAGTFKLTDTDKTSNAIEADFSSIDVSYNSATQLLLINGRLSTRAGNSSILVNRDPGDGSWVYAGQAAYTPDNDDDDGTDGTITITDPHNYDLGQLIWISFNVGGFSDLDDLFSSDVDVERGGTVHGDVVPLPGALMLGALGLGLISRLRRRLS